MCRIAILPPRFNREESLDILKTFEGGNTDGTGYAYVKDGKFIVEKWAGAYSKVIKKEKDDFLGHLEKHDGITICHLRAATHGDACTGNAHPWVVGEHAYLHNGVWSDYKYAKMGLSADIKLEGDTDSEVAAHCIENVGMEKFVQNVNFGGVFVALALDGTLEIGKVSGDIKSFTLNKDGTVLLASSLGYKYKGETSLCDGVHTFDKNLKHIATKQRTYTYGTTYGGTCGTSRSVQRFFSEGCGFGMGEDETETDVRVIGITPTSRITTPTPTFVPSKDKKGEWVRNADGTKWTKRYFTDAEIAAKEHGKASTADIVGAGVVVHDLENCPD